MPHLLTEDADLRCAHELGRVQNEPTQTLVTIAGRRVLVADNPEGKKIKGCPNFGIVMKPCQRTLAVKEGYSTLLRIEGRAICLEPVRGLTDGTPPGTVNYHVKDAGQAFVQEVL